MIARDDILDVWKDVVLADATGGHDAGINALRDLFNEVEVDIIEVHAVLESMGLPFLQVQAFTAGFVIGAVLVQRRERKNDDA